MAPSFESSKAGYRNLWNRMAVRSSVQPAADRAAKIIIANRGRYEAVEKQTGVPWFFIACLHNRESGMDFKTYLGNGEPLNRVTKLVPQGRGPFSSWEAGAIDALKLEGFHKIAEWDISRIGFSMEKFNGWGYIGKTNSPYLWAGSSLYASGKYIADHVYSTSAVDKQLGGMVVLARLCALDKSINERVNGHAPPPPDIEPPAPVPAKPAPKGGFFAAILNLFRRQT